VFTSDRFRQDEGADVVDVVVVDAVVAVAAVVAAIVVVTSIKPKHEELLNFLFVFWSRNFFFYY
jgi:hypothetical protein